MSEKRKGAILVFFQFSLLIAIIVLPHSSQWVISDWLGTVALVMILLGLSMTLLGVVSLGSSLSVNPVPKNEAVLRKTGVYSIVRHPIYLGILILGCGLTIPTGSFLTLFAYLLLVVTLSFKARFEERLLLAKFPEYREYGSKIGRIVPFLGKLNR